MEFILNNRKYSIQNHELFVNYLIVDSYFRQGYSKYDYDIRFEFIEPILKKEKVEFDDILENTKVLEELIETEQISVIPNGLRIDEHVNGNFRISYQDLVFSNIHVGEAIPLILALNSLLNYKPIISLGMIEEEIENFIKMFREYNRHHFES